MVPFEVIRDDGWNRSVDGAWRDPAEFFEGVRASARSYRRDKQVRQPFAVIILVEAAGMVPQLARVADPYSIPVMSSSGFDSLTVKKTLSDLVMDSYPDRKTVFLHVGDLDPYGVCIFDSVKADVEAFADPGASEFKRVAVTEEQVKEYSLPTSPPKPTDKRGRAVKATC